MPLDLLPAQVNICMLGECTKITGEQGNEVGREAVHSLQAVRGPGHTGSVTKTTTHVVRTTRLMRCASLRKTRTNQLSKGETCDTSGLHSARATHKELTFMQRLAHTSTQREPLLQSGKTCKCIFPRVLRVPSENAPLVNQRRRAAFITYWGEGPLQTLGTSRDPGAERRLRATSPRPASRRVSCRLSEGESHRPLALAGVFSCLKTLW